jgi:gliding motility-associated-like protein
VPNKLTYWIILFCVLQFVPVMLRSQENLPLKNIPAKSCYFVENKGQIIDQYNHLNPKVKFLLNLPGLKVQLKKNSFSYEVIKAEEIQEKDKEEIPLPVPGFKANKNCNFKIHRIDIQFIGANPNSEIIPSLPTDEYLNFYTTGTSNNGVTFVHQYQRILYKDLYPNIDLEFIVSNDAKNQNGLKFNYIVRPGGDISKIKWTYQGTDEFSIVIGKIKIKTSISDIEEAIPLSWIKNNSQKLDIDYKISDNNICSFTNYPEIQSSDTIWIDPVPTLLWCTYYGGSNTDEIRKIVLDSTGNIYLAGDSWSTAYIATTGAYQTTLSGIEDGFVVKMNTYGVRQWGTYFGGPADDVVFGATTAGNNGTITLTGYTKSSTNIASSNAFKNYISGESDAFITQFDQAGVRLYSSYFGGPGAEFGRSIATDNNGNIIMVGVTTSTTGIATNGSHQIIYAGGMYDCYIVKFTPNCFVFWSTYFGGEGGEEIREVLTDTSNNIYIAGYTSSNYQISSPSAFQTANRGPYDCFIAKFNASGSLLWGTYFGGTSIEQLSCMAIDGNSNLVITGLTQSQTFISTVGSYQQYFSGTGSYYDVFIAKFNSNGGRLWSTYYGNGKENYSYICFDRIGNIYVGGSTEGNNLATANSMQPLKRGIGDSYILKLSQSGARMWCTYFGGSGYEFSYSIVSDPNFAIYIAGMTSSTDSMTTPNAHQTALIGSGSDAYIAKFSDCVSLFSANTLDTCINRMISFTNQSGAYSNSYSSLWNFGDGSTSTSSNATHQFAIPGNYNVSLTITATDNCVSTLTKTVRVFPITVADFIINDSVQCLSGNSFYMKNKSFDSTSKIYYLWDMGDGKIETAVNPTHTYSKAGNYIIKLRSYTSARCDDTKSKSIKIFPQTTASFSVSDTVLCFTNNKFNFSNTSTGADFYSWDFGDGSSDTISEPEHSYAIADTFQVSFISHTNIGCTDTAYRQLIVLPSPVADFSLNDTFSCFGTGNFIFTNKTAISNGTVSYMWNFGNSKTSNVADTSFSYIVPGIYDIRLIAVSDKGCTDTANSRIYSNPVPVADMSLSDTLACLVGNNFIIRNKSSISGGIISSCKLLIPDDSVNINIAVNSEIQHSFPKADTFIISLIVTSDQNCIDTINRLATIKPNPSMNIITADSFQCLRHNRFNFSAVDQSELAGNGLTYVWDFKDGNTGSQKAETLKYSSTGTYLISLIASSNENCMDTAELKIKVNPSPETKFDYFYPQCPDTNYTLIAKSDIKPSGIIVSNVWKFANDADQIGEIITHSFTNSGYDKVTLIAISDQGCTDTFSRELYINPYPGTTILDRATVTNDQAIQLDWRAGTSTMPINWILYRSVDNGAYNEYTRLNTQQLQFRDNLVDASQHLYSYMLMAIDSCFHTSEYSNQARPVLLTVDSTTLYPELKWTEYIQWDEQVEKYNVEIYKNADNSFFTITENNPSLLIFDDNLTRLNQSHYSYRITAIRNGDGQTSNSNIVDLPTKLNFYMPNAFTPNNDGINDVFTCYGTFIMEYSLCIYDRWGMQLFRSDDIQKGWDGKYNGQICPAGAYYFRVVAKGTQGQNFIKTGNVILF